MSVVRSIRLALVAAVVAATAAGAAWSADEASFAITEGGATFFPNQVYVVTLDEKRQLTSGEVTVTENGKPISGVAVRPAASAQGIGTVLLIDASNSMKKTIGRTMEAARTFAARNPGPTRASRPVTCWCFMAPRRRLMRPSASCCRAASERRDPLFGPWSLRRMLRRSASAHPK